MNISNEQMLEINILGILPVLLSFIVLLSTVIVACMKKNVLSSIEESDNKKRFRGTEKINSCIAYLTKIYIFVALTLAIVPILFIFDIKYESYIYGMIKNVGVVSDIVIGLTAIAITMTVVVILFDKGYYIVFSIREVLQKYKFIECLIIVIVSCIVVSVTTMTLLNEKVDSVSDVVRFVILEIATIYNVIGVAYILGVIVNIMFLENKSELSILGQLHTCFWSYRIDTLRLKNKKNWSKEAVEINIEYLLERYLGICKSKKIASLVNIEFVTTTDCYQQIWYRKVRKKYIYVMFSFLLVSIIVDSIVLKENCKWLIIINIIATVIPLILAYVNMQSFQWVIMNLFLDEWGYFLITNDKKEIFTSRVPLIKNVYSKYIMRMNSLNAFYHIWLNYGNSKKKDIKVEFKEMLEYLEGMENKNMVTLFPAFTIGFFLFEKNIKIGKLKKIYNEIIVGDDSQYLFERMMYSQVYYLTKNFEKEPFGYKDRLNKFFQWLQD